MLRRLSKLLTAAQSEGQGRLASYFDWATADTVSKMFLPDYSRALHDQPLLQALETMPATVTPLQRMLLLEQRYFLADHNLNYTDKMSMAAGVETRVPFLDLEMVGLAAGIPDSYRQHGAVGKWVLKKAMEGILPSEVIYRPKTGFGVPLRAWLLGPLNDMKRDLLCAGTVHRRGLFEPTTVLQLLSDAETGRADHAYSIFSLMCIELWCQEFVDTQPDRSSEGPMTLVGKAERSVSTPIS
jgi:asparagine synthase (glutamine-hydrolysing)